MPLVTESQHSQTTGAADASPIRVCLWSPWGAGEHYHGPGSFSYRLYATAPAGRFAVTLAHGSAHQEQYQLFRQQHLISTLNPGLLSHWRFLRKSRAWLAEHARQFDVFHGLSGFHITVEPAAIAQQLGLPAVVFIANHRIELTDKPGLKGLLGLPARRRKKIRNLSAVIAMSQAIHEELLECGVPEQRIARIPMGVDMHRFKPAADAAERQSLRAQFHWRDIPTVVFVGGVVERKQPHLIVEAIGLLKRKGVECQLALVGPATGEHYVEMIKTKARELGVERQIIWFGFTKDIAPVFRAADFFCLPSSKEGMPAALVEAMASALPSIVTPISGCTDLINDGSNGRIISDTADEIAEALYAYIAEPQLAQTHGEMARQTVSAQYSADAVLAAYERLFRRIVAGGDAAE